MALADNPPSGTFYDPEHDGIAMASQGVHEHWNNATEKQYTRNLGTGNGIELLYVPKNDPRCGKTEQPIVIDGTVDAAWTGASVQTLSNWSWRGLRRDDLSASFRALYDDTNLYLLAEVTDDVVMNDSAPGITMTASRS